VLPPHLLGMLLQIRNHIITRNIRYGQKYNPASHVHTLGLKQSLHHIQDPASIINRVLPHIITQRGRVCVSTELAADVLKRGSRSGRGEHNNTRNDRLTRGCWSAYTQDLV
jgi:hypothetical protein